MTRKAIFTEQIEENLDEKFSSLTSRLEFLSQLQDFSKTQKSKPLEIQISLLKKQIGEDIKKLTLSGNDLGDLVNRFSAIITRGKIEEAKQKIEQSQNHDGVYTDLMSNSLYANSLTEKERSYIDDEFIRKELVSRAKIDPRRIELENSYLVKGMNPAVAMRKSYDEFLKSEVRENVRQIEKVEEEDEETVTMKDKVKALLQIKKAPTEEQFRERIEFLQSKILSEEELDELVRQIDEKDITTDQIEKIKELINKLKGVLDRLPEGQTTNISTTTKRINQLEDKIKNLQLKEKNKKEMEIQQRIQEGEQSKQQIETTIQEGEKIEEQKQILRNPRKGVRTMLEKIRQEIEAGRVDMQSVLQQIKEGKKEDKKEDKKEKKEEDKIQISNEEDIKIDRETLSKSEKLYEEQMKKVEPGINATKNYMGQSYNKEYAYELFQEDVKALIGMKQLDIDVSAHLRNMNIKFGALAVGRILKILKFSDEDIKALQKVSQQRYDALISQQPSEQKTKKKEKKMQA